MKNQFDKETIICLLAIFVAVVVGVLADEAQIRAGKISTGKTEVVRTAETLSARTPEAATPPVPESRPKAKANHETSGKPGQKSSPTRAKASAQTSTSPKASVTSVQTTVPKQTKKPDKKVDPASKQAGITTINGVKIANKSHPLPADYNPGLTQETAAAYQQLEAAMRAQGFPCFIVSGFRSYETQVAIYNNFVAMYGREEADRISARPGFSEHQLGQVLDVNSLEQSFGQTPEGIWIHNHCWEYGFIIRYPKGKDAITGYSYEPWHLRHVGKDLAAKLYNGGDWITLEEHFGIKSSYSD